MSVGPLVPFPSFAPLPSSLVNRFVEEREKYDFLPASYFIQSAQTVCALPYFQTERASLERQVREMHREGESEESGNLIAALLSQVQQKRAATYTLMNPFAAALSTEWLLKQLSENRHTVTPTTLSRWREAGLLRYDKKDRPEADSVAALLIAAQLHKQRRGFLPSTLIEGEPAWWCWRQDRPSAPVLPCPVPLPDDLPSSALLWTQWTGAGWHPEWLNVGQRGAIRWAGTRMVNGKLLWDMPFDRLTEWVPAIIANAEEMEVTFEELETTPEILHTLANIALLHLARRCLRTVPFQNASS